MNTINKKTIQILSKEGQFVTGLTSLKFIDLDQTKYIAQASGDYNYVDGEYVAVTAGTGTHVLNPNYELTVSEYWEHNTTKAVVFVDPSDAVNYTYHTGIDEVGEGIYVIAYDFADFPIRRIKLLIDPGDGSVDTFEEELEFAILMDYDAMSAFYTATKKFTDSFIVRVAEVDTATADDAYDDGYELIPSGESGYIAPGADGYPAIRLKTGWVLTEPAEYKFSKWVASSKLWMDVSSGNRLLVNFNAFGADNTYEIELLDSNYITTPDAPVLSVENVSNYKEQTKIKEAIITAEQQGYEEDIAVLESKVATLNFQLSSGALSAETYNSSMEIILNTGLVDGGTTYLPLVTLYDRVIALHLKVMATIGVEENYYTVLTFDEPSDPHASNPIVQYELEYAIVPLESFKVKEINVEDPGDPGNFLDLFERRVVGDSSYKAISLPDPKNPTVDTIDFDEHFILGAMRPVSIDTGVRVYSTDTSLIRRFELLTHPNITYSFRVAAISKNGVRSAWSNKITYTIQVPLIEETAFTTNVGKLIDMKYAKSVALPGQSVDSRLDSLESSLAKYVSEDANTDMNATWEETPAAGDGILDTWVLRFDLEKYKEAFSYIVVEPFIQRTNTLSVGWIHLLEAEYLKSAIPVTNNIISWEMTSANEDTFNKLWYYGKTTLSTEAGSSLDGLTTEALEFADIKAGTNATYKYHEITRLDEFGIAPFMRFRLMLLSATEYAFYCKSKNIAE